MIFLINSHPHNFIHRIIHLGSTEFLSNKNNCGVALWTPLFSLELKLYTYNRFSL